VTAGKRHSRSAATSKIFKKSACEIFHDEAILKFSNPQLVWLIEQLVSSEANFFGFTVKPFSKIFWVYAFFAAIFVANVNAQTGDQSAG
jgi:hypothetical protein